jgi:hypothetical protein
VRVGRGLSRLANQGLKLGYPGRKTLNQRRLLQQQGVLFGLTQANARQAIHRKRGFSPTFSAGR